MVSKNTWNGFPRSNQRQEVLNIKSMDLSDEQLNAILGGNAQKLLDI